MWALILVSFLVLCAAAIAFPLFGKAVPWATESQLASLEEAYQARERVIRLLKDLEGDYESGQVQDGQYDTLQRAYLDEAALIKRRIEALESGDSAKLSNSTTNSED